MSELGLLVSLGNKIWFLSHMWKYILGWGGGRVLEPIPSGYPGTSVYCHYFIKYIFVQSQKQTCKWARKKIGTFDFKRWTKTAEVQGSLLFIFSLYKSGGGNEWGTMLGKTFWVLFVFSIILRVHRFPSPISSYQTTKDYCSFNCGISVLFNKYLPFSSPFLTKCKHLK